MKDFSFNDSMEEENGYNNDPGEKKKIVKFLIIVVVAAIAGFSVYFITDALINGNRKTTVVTTAKDMEMDLNDEMIVYLYDNVTYSVNGVRNPKFFSSGSVTADSFTNEEKIYFALRYAVESDFIDLSTSSTGDMAEDETTEKVLKTYSISNDKIREYVFNFFGDKVSYSTSTPVNIKVNFSKDGFNAGILKYDATSDSWKVQFDSVSEGGPNMVINPYLYKIESAMREGKTNNIIIKEKVVFTAYKQYTDEAGNLVDKFDCGIYKDFAKTSVIEQKTGVVENQLTMLGIENYKENASTVTYTFFKDENDEYHFLSSQISSN